MCNHRHPIEEDCIYHILSKIGIFIKKWAVTCISSLCKNRNFMQKSEKSNELINLDKTVLQADGYTDKQSQIQRALQQG